MFTGDIWTAVLRPAQSGWIIADLSWTRCTYPTLSKVMYVVKVVVCQSNHPFHCDDGGKTMVVCYRGGNFSDARRVHQSKIFRQTANTPRQCWSSMYVVRVVVCQSNPQWSWLYLPPTISSVSNSNNDFEKEKLFRNPWLDGPCTTCLGLCE